MLPFLYLNTATETAPEEDQGFFFVVGQVPQYATLNYTETYTNLLMPFIEAFLSQIIFSPLMRICLSQVWS